MIGSLTLNRPLGLRTAEFRLLAACSYYSAEQWSQQRQQLETALGEQPDPQVFNALIKRHRLPALVATVLSRLAQETNQDLSAFFNPQAARRTGMRNLVFHGELQRLQQRFAEAKILLFPLKGTGLSLQIYGDLGLRQMKDIDLLVNPDDLVKAMDVLEQAGYEVELPTTLRTDQQIGLVKKIGWHIDCHHPKQNIHLELHWRFERVQDTAIEPLWWNWINSTDPVTRLHHELLFLCLHGASHGWHRFKWLGDLHMLIARLPEQEWPQLIDLSRTVRMDAVLAETLLLLSEFFKTPLPPEALDFVTQHHSAALTLANDAMIWIDEDVEGTPSSVWAHIKNLWHKLRLTASMGHRYSTWENLRYWVMFLGYNPVDIIALHIPKSLHWLYPIIRPFSLLARWLKTAMP